jgi:DNA-binding NarL/FixJ family response regulator
MNIEAGTIAKKAGSYDIALDFYKTGIEFLLPNEDLSENSHSDSRREVNGNFSEITTITIDSHLPSFPAQIANQKQFHSLFTEIGETEYLKGNFDIATEYLDKVIKATIPIVSKIKAYEIMILIYTANNNINKAFNTGIGVLKEMGILFKEKPSKSDFENSFANVKELLVLRGCKEIKYLPKMQDIQNESIIQFITCFIIPANNINPDLTKILMLKIIELSMELGNCSFSVIGYTWYAVFLMYYNNDVENGYDFALSALELLDQFEDNKNLKGKVYYYFSAFFDKKSDELNNIFKAYELSQKNNDHQYVCMSIYTYCSKLLFNGTNLNTVWNEFQKYKAIIQSNYKNDFIISLFDIYESFLTSLLLVGYEKVKIEEHLYQNLFSYYFLELYHSYLFEDYLKGLEIAEKAEEQIDKIDGLYFLPEFNFYYCLILLSIYNGAEEHEKSYYLIKINKLKQSIYNFSKINPDSFLHKYLLIEAEQSRVTNNNKKAIKLYDEAINAASYNNYINIEAIANEIAARFYLSRGKDKVAEEYIYQAHVCYLKWGAISKANDIEHKYLHLMQDVVKRKKSQDNNIAKTSVRDNLLNFLYQYGITNQEYKIIMLIIEGKSNKNIAQDFDISEHTVKKHVSKIFNKLTVKNRYELISYIRNL